MTTKSKETLRFSETATETDPNDTTALSASTRTQSFLRVASCGAIESTALEQCQTTSRDSSGITFVRAFESDYNEENTDCAPKPKEADANDTTTLPPRRIEQPALARVHSCAERRTVRSHHVNCSIEPPQQSVPLTR